jgi:hypothetical protein
MSEEDEAAGLLELQALERGLAAALRASDRAGGRASLAATPGLSARGRARVASSGISADGFEMAALLVARLRFERLMQGSEAASRWFDADPAASPRRFGRITRRRRRAGSFRRMRRRCSRGSSRRRARTGHKSQRLAVTGKS